MKKILRDLYFKNFTGTGSIHEMKYFTNTVEPLFIRTPSGPAVLSFIERLSSFRGDFYRVCVQETFGLSFVGGSSSFGVSFIGGFTVSERYGPQQPFVKLKFLKWKMMAHS